MLENRLQCAPVLIFIRKGGYLMGKFIVLSDDLNKKRLKMEGENFQVKAKIVFTKEFDKRDFEKLKNHTYEMIYNNEYPILVKMGAPLQLRIKIIAAALSELEERGDSIDDILSNEIKVSGSDEVFPNERSVDETLNKCIMVKSDESSPDRRSIEYDTQFSIVNEFQQLSVKDQNTIKTLIELLKHAEPDMVSSLKEIIDSQYFLFSEYQQLSKESQNIVIKLMKILKQADTDMILSLKTIIKIAYNNCIK